MKRKCICLIFIIIIGLCTACYRPDSVSGSGFYEAYQILNADVPFADNLHTAQFDSVTKLEEDQFGRQYFCYTTFSTILWLDINVYVICQKTDDTDVYYYQDYCYVISASNEEPLSSTTIAELKERNDWDLPLDEDKMSRVSFSWYQDVVSQDDMEKTLHNFFQLNEEDSVIYNGLEMIDTTQQLFYVHVYYCDEFGSGQNSKDYLLIYDSSKSQPIAAIQEVEATLDCQDAVNSFRMTWFES